MLLWSGVSSSQCAQFAVPSSSTPRRVLGGGRNQPCWSPMVLARARGLRGSAGPAAPEGTADPVTSDARHATAGDPPAQDEPGRSRELGKGGHVAVAGHGPVGQVLDHPDVVAGELAAPPFDACGAHLAARRTPPPGGGPAAAGQDPFVLRRAQPREQRGQHPLGIGGQHLVADLAHAGPEGLGDLDRTPPALGEDVDGLVGPDPVQSSERRHHRPGSRTMKITLASGYQS